MGRQGTFGRGLLVGCLALLLTLAACSSKDETHTPAVEEDTTQEPSPSDTDDRRDAPPGDAHLEEPLDTDEHSDVPLEDSDSDDPDAPLDAEDLEDAEARDEPATDTLEDADQDVVELPFRWVLTFERGPSPQTFSVHVTLLGTSGAAIPLQVESVYAEAEGAQIDAVLEGPDGSVVLELLAERVDAGVEVTVWLEEGPRITRELLPLAEVHGAWGMPEFVPGMVNTPGWEDSSEISPDGQWLLVSTYTPVDAFSCNQAASAVDHPSCNTPLGPWTAPQRPELPGADRIDSAGSIAHRVPALCLVGEGGGDFPVAMPPTAAYGFRLQEDGSFAEPFVIAYAMDGYSVAPFGFSFVGEVVDGRAEVVYAHADIREFDDKGLTPNLYVAPLTLGASNTLGRFTCGLPDGLVYSAGVDERLPILPHSVHKGNPYLEANRARVWFDDEGSDRSLVYFSDVTEDGWQGRRAAGAPVNEDGAASYQPFRHGERLFWARDFRSIQSAALRGGDPGDPWAWADRRVEIGLDAVTGPPDAAAPGLVVAIGEPSVATDADGVTWLYFVAIRRTPTGYDADIARVRASAP